MEAHGEGLEYAARAALPAAAAGARATRRARSFLGTHRFSLEDSPRAYEMFKKKEDGLVRAVFEP